MFKKGKLQLIDGDNWTIILNRSKNNIEYFNLNSTDIFNMLQTNNFLKGHSHLISSANEHVSKINNEISYISKHPPLRIFDKPLSSIANEVSFTYDQFHRRFGFRNLHKILPIIKSTCKNNFSISSADTEPIQDIGSLSTVDKSKKYSPSHPTSQLRRHHTYGHCIPRKKLHQWN